MGLGITLQNALSGLNVNQQQLTILSQNIANANTQGYSKQIARQSAVYINGEANGVTVADVVRRVDDYLTAAVQKQGSALAANTIIDDYNTRIQLLTGNPGNQNSIDSYINTFFNAVQSLVQTPQNTTLQQTALNSGVALADQISSLANGLRQLQYQADQDIAAAVNQVNSDLSRIAGLNNQIASSVSLGKNVANLQDQRDTLIKSIGENINVSTYLQTNGAMSATTGNGITLLDSTIYQIKYTPAAGVETFNDNTSLSPMTIFRVNAAGDPISPPITLTTAAPATEVESVFTTGKIAGLMQMRDEQIPDLMAQLDTLAAAMRDHFNAIHNSGSGYPGANSFTGTRAVYGEQVNQWSGQVRIAVLDSNGQAAPSPYSDETNGIKPLLLDLEKMDTLSGVGNPSVQGIIDAINSYYGIPQNKLKLGSLNNIQLVSDNASIPASPPKFSFDFNLDNLSNGDGKFFVTDVAVRNNNGVDITSVSDTIPRFDLSPVNTYTTTTGSNSVTINTQGSNSLTEGQVVYLSTPPGGPFDGIPASSLGGYFTIRNVTGNSFDITTNAYATGGSTHGVANQTVLPPYAEAKPGQETRAKSNGTITADLTADSLAPFYTISVTIGVADANGVVQTSVVDYRVNNQQPNALNKMIGAQSQVGSGVLVSPTNLNPLLTAKLIDENGAELPKVNGRYTNEKPGYLQLKAGNSLYNIAVDSMDSREMGNPTVSPVIPGSNRGFSHYFELNDFFVSNKPINTGDTIFGSAVSMAVETRLRTNPGLMSLGQMIKSPDPADPNQRRNYTYQLNPGDNSVIARLSALSATNVNYIASGGLGATLNTFTGYAGQVIGSAATNAATARTNKQTADALMEGFTENASAISGVNLDVELANTVIYQNAYSASARVITVANELFDTLLQSV